jgi:hypothetical protein
MSVCCSLSGHQILSTEISCRSILVPPKAGFQGYFWWRAHVKAWYSWLSRARVSRQRVTGSIARDSYAEKCCELFVLGCCTAILRHDREPARAVIAWARWDDGCGQTQYTTRDRLLLTGKTGVLVHRIVHNAGWVLVANPP